MRKADVEVREVVCSETGKPLAKIPLWMADVKVGPNMAQKNLSNKLS